MLVTPLVAIVKERCECNRTGKRWFPGGRLKGGRRSASGRVVAGAPAVAVHGARSVAAGVVRSVGRHGGNTASSPRSMGFQIFLSDYDARIGDVLRPEK